MGAHFPTVFGDVTRLRALGGNDWRALIHDTVKSLAPIISADTYEVREPYFLDPPNFGVWFWTTRSPHPLGEFASPLWTCVCSGQWMGENDYSVSALVFLFHAPSMVRLLSDNGGEYFVMNLSKNTGKWIPGIWERGEPGEWSAANIHVPASWKAKA